MRVARRREAGGDAVLAPSSARITPFFSPQASGAEPAVRVCVIFATRGRAELLAETVAALGRQSHQPASVIVSCPMREDAGTIPARGVTLVLGARGLAAQRNRALDHVPDGTDVVVFFDDDFFPDADWIARVVETFARHADVGAVTGHVVADGVKGPGLAPTVARALLAKAPRPAAAPMIDGYVPYGCNMAFRWSMIASCRFDERLVLYGWLEDRDFGAALARRGLRTVKVGAAMGVHLGVKAGRMPGRQLGYSQVANPLYLHRKGTMSLRAVADHLFRNIASNAGRALRPEPHVDRRGRLSGNLHAIGDLLRGRLEPERAAHL